MNAVYQEARRAVIKAVLVDSWYRYSRYETADEAGPALENIAALIDVALQGIPR